MLTDGPDASQLYPKAFHLAHTHTDVDVRGLPCPLPVVRLAEVVRTLPVGTLVRLLGTDLALRQDLPAWCQATGHRLVSLAVHREVLEAWVEVAPVRR
ncbi:MAG: sulfurtransferase TusA family protein [Myxococcaceae bacterium]